MRHVGWLACAVGLLAGVPAAALGPEDVFLLVNRNVPESRQVAEHYCHTRGVPADHIITLDLPTGEDVSRADYDRKLAAPLRAALKGRRDQVKVLVSTYGVPLRVGPQEPDADDRQELAAVQAEAARLQADRRWLEKQLATLETGRRAEPLALVRQDRDDLLRQQQRLQRRQGWLSYAESQACVDSELSLLWWDDYELRRWQVNLLNFQVPDAERQKKPPIVMVSRLDGPSAAVAMRLVDDAVAAERKGLTGKVYVDARGIGFDPKQDTGTGYGGYDESLREMARLLGKEAGLPVVLDDRPELFAAGACPDCALYCGWYALANYVPCCRFVPGAVAYHIASAEAVSLRDPRAKFWCKNLLADGVAATLGPVAEPYTIGFPKPAEFFGLLATGKYPLVECYYRTALLNSWMTVLVGDPLYNPFGKAPKLQPDQVAPSPAGGRPFGQRRPGRSE